MMLYSETLHSIDYGRGNIYSRNRKRKKETNSENLLTQASMLHNV